MVNCDIDMVTEEGHTLVIKIFQGLHDSNNDYDQLPTFYVKEIFSVYWQHQKINVRKDLLTCIFFFMS